MTVLDLTAHTLLAYHGCVSAPPEKGPPDMTEWFQEPQDAQVAYTKAGADEQKAEYEKAGYKARAKKVDNFWVVTAYEKNGD